jgi:hypothetical protein
VIEWSARTLVDPADFIRMHAARMRHAAAELHFETAAKIKAYVEQISQLGKGPYRHARLLEDFQFVSFQHGPRPGSAKVFLIIQGRIQEVACMIDEPLRPAELLGTTLQAAENVGKIASMARQIRPDVGLSANQFDRPAAGGPPSAPAFIPREIAPKDTIDLVGAERIGIVAHHLFSGKPSHGVFIRFDELSEKGIVRAYHELRKRPAEEAGEVEGVMKELQSL